MQPNKVLIIGLGSIAIKHIAALRALNPLVEITALRSDSLGPQIDTIKSVYTITEAEIAAYDFVIISNPSFLHAESIKKVGSHAKALFIEKPAFLSFKEGKDVVALIGDKLNYVACNLRFLDALVQVKKLLVEGLISPSLVQFQAVSYLPDWRPTQDYRLSYSASLEKGGGVVFDLIHEPDYIYWLFGESNASYVKSGQYSDLAIQSPDTAVITFEYETFLVTGVLSYASKVSKRFLQITAKEGFFEVDLLSNSIMKNGTLIFSSEQRINDTYLQQMKHFVSVINGELAAVNDVKQALVLTKMLHLD